MSSKLRQRRRRIAGAVVAVSLVLAGCGGGGGNDDPSAGGNTSREPVPGVTDTEVRFGDTVALTGNFAVVTGPFLAAARSYLAKVNEAGGVHGRKITLDMVDDGLNTEQAVTGARRFVNSNNILAAAFPFGTAATLAKSPIYARANIPYFQYGLAAIDQKASPLEFGVVPSYHSQIQTAIKYAIENRGGKKFAILVTADANGTELAAGAKKALAENDLQPISEVTYTTGTTDFGGQLSEVKDAEYIIVQGSTPDLARLAVAQSRQGVKGKLIGSVAIGDPTFLELTAGAGEGALVGSPLFPLDSEGAGIKEFKADLAKYGEGAAPGLWALLGYHQAKVLVEGLENAGKDLTRESFVEGLEAIRNYESGVAPPVSFGPDTHNCDKCPVAILEIKGGKYVEVKV